MIASLSFIKIHHENGTQYEFNADVQTKWRWQEMVAQMDGVGTGQTPGKRYIYVGNRD